MSALNSGLMYVFPHPKQEQNPGGYEKPKPALRMATRSVAAAAVTRPAVPAIVEDMQGEVPRMFNVQWAFGNAIDHFE